MIYLFIPTVNRQPLPKAFLLSGWKEPYDCLNGEYLPLDDGAELLNGRPIFKHTPVVGLLGHQQTWQMCWSDDAWRIANKDHLQGKCVAFVKSDTIHPADTPAGVVWKGAVSGCTFDEDDKNFEPVEGVSVVLGTVRTSLSLAL